MSRIMIKSKQDSDKLNIVGFVCNWGAYTGLEMAGINKREYPASVKLVKLMCLGRLHLGLILKSFELGADGVVLLGCPPQECHYDSGMEKAKGLFAQAKRTLHLLGIDPKRLDLIEVPLGRDDVFAKRVSAFVKYVSRASLSTMRIIEEAKLNKGLVSCEKSAK